MKEKLRTPTSGNSDEGEKKKSLSGLLITLIGIFIVMTTVFIYWFVPLNTINFGTAQGNSNFSLASDSNMQFYKNMRFPSSEISYQIYDCPLNKKNSMEEAFKILENKTVLRFFPVDSNEAIFVTCDSKNKLEGNLFIAGEGGPTNITRTSNFNVISGGKILLIRESTCPIPNVEIHELFHVLGFDHSSNPMNIMYNISDCEQTIGDDTLNLINELYSYESLPDLALGNVSSFMNGKYLNTNISLINDGLIASQEANIKIYADGEVVKEIPVEPLDVRYGKVIILTNIHVNQISVDELSVEIDYPYPELNKENNKIKLN